MTGDTCSAAAACPLSAGRTYSACTNGTQCSFHTSDGTVFPCGSCADCAAASTKVSSWCGGTGGSDGGAPTLLDAGVGGISPDPTCATLLTCLSNNAPNAFTVALQTYGSGGACWQNGSTAQSCHNACETSLAQYQKSGQCCVSDGDCHGTTPHCDTVKNTCVGCPFACCQASDCTGRGSCDATTHSCTCASANDCTNQSAAYCDPQAHVCESCPFACCSSNDCSGGVCDPGSHSCVGCLANNQCGIPIIQPEVCDLSSHQCVGCVSDGDCANRLLYPKQTLCSAAKECVECLQDSQCATGHCSAAGACVCLADGDCGGGGRLCHVSTGQCDQCADDTQCTAAGQTHCGLDRSGIKDCGECATNTQCTGPNHCLDQICTTKGCFGDEDCGSSFYCNASGQCTHP